MKTETKINRSSKKYAAVFTAIVAIEPAIRYGGEGIEIADYICGKYLDRASAINAAKNPSRIGGRYVW